MAAPSISAARPTWVQVPVPAELFDQVQVFILHLSLRGSKYAWDLDAMATHLDSLDDRSRAVVSLVARSALEGQALTVRGIAELMDTNVREVFGCIHLANNVADGVARPDLFWTKSPAGRGTASDELLMMTEPLVDLVVRLDRDATLE